MLSFVWLFVTSNPGFRVTRPFCYTVNLHQCVLTYSMTQMGSEQKRPIRKGLPWVQVQTESCNGAADGLDIQSRG